MTLVRRHSHGAEHGRLRYLSFVTGRACRRGNLGHALQQLGTNVADKVHVQRVGQPPLGMTVQNDFLSERAMEQAPKAIAKLAQPLGRLRQALAGDRARLAEGDDVWNIFRPCPPA